MAAVTMFPLVATASVLGVASHLAYFMHGEHHLSGLRIVQSAFILPCLLFFSLSRLFDVPAMYAFNLATATWWAFVLSLWTSMLLYRACFHRLGSYPGPFPARLSAWWHSQQAAGFRNYEVIDALHARYGEYVRIGPAELSISDPDAVESIHGPRTKCTKAPWYDLVHPFKSVQMTRSKAVHDKRRRAVWDRAFGTKALRSYDPCVLSHADKLIAKLTESAGKPINASRWFNFFTADTLTQLAFAKPLGMLETGTDHWTIQLLQDSSKLLVLWSVTSYMVPILTSIPGLAKADARGLQWCKDRVHERQQVDVAQPDIMTWFLDPLETMSDQPAVNDMWLLGDARLVVIAGTDTTTAGLTYATFHLAQDPDRVQKIRDELREHGIGRDGDFSILALQSCDFLNAVIDETLRLHPPVPSGVERLTPPEGLQIGEHFVPGDIIVSTPTYTVQRSPKCFVQPDTFIPERWTTQPDLILNKRVFSPFSIGTYSCVGKQLALMELRTVLAKIVLAFDVRLAPGEDGRRLLQETKDYFVLGLAELGVVFTPRTAS